MSLARRRNWSMGLGPPLAIAGFVSYFTLLYRWPALRDVPWANYALLALALGLSARGLARAWPRGGALRRALAGLGLAFSGAVALFFVWYIALGSRDLPSDQGGLPLGAPLPAVALADPSGARVELASLEQPLVIVFYRGFW